MVCAPLTACLDVVLRENYPLPTPLSHTGRGWLRFAMVLSSERLLSWLICQQHLHNWEAWLRFFFFQFTILLSMTFVHNSVLSKFWNQTNLKRLKLQPIGVEIEGNLKLLELQLENVEGGKMEVIPLRKSCIVPLKYPLMTTLTFLSMVRHIKLFLV